MWLLSRQRRQAPSFNREGNAPRVSPVPSIAATLNARPAGHAVKRSAWLLSRQRGREPSFNREGNAPRVSHSPIFAIIPNTRPVGHAVKRSIWLTSDQRRRAPSFNRVGNAPRVSHSPIFAIIPNARPAGYAVKRSIWILSHQRGRELRLTAWATPRALQRTPPKRKTRSSIRLSDRGVSRRALATGPSCNRPQADLPHPKFAKKHPAAVQTPYNR